MSESLQGGSVQLAQSSRPRILVTCFEPFGGSDINPTMLIAEALRGMPSAHGSREYVVLPVVGGVGSTSAWSKFLPVQSFFKPDAIVALGESAKADRVHFERVAVNLRDSRIADNEGVQVVGLPVLSLAPDEFFATLPLRTMMAACERTGTPAALSMSAGTFLCNELMFRLLAHEMSRGGESALAGFLHVPQLPEQAALRGGPSMAIEHAARGVHAAIEALAELLTAGTARGETP